jgi:hypothetical protein
MNSFAIPFIGILTALAGVVFLIGCFVRVDSKGFIDRASGDEAKIARLHSLQAAWDRIGKLRQFIASSSGFLIVGIAMLLAWQRINIPGQPWIVPAILALNLAAVLWVRSHAVRVLEKDTIGGTEVLKVIKQNIRLCITFSIIYVLLVAAV